MARTQLNVNVLTEQPTTPPPVTTGIEITGGLYVLPPYPGYGSIGPAPKRAMVYGKSGSPMNLVDGIEAALKDLFPDSAPSFTDRRFTLTIHKD